MKEIKWHFKRSLESLFYSIPSCLGFLIYCKDISIELKFIICFLIGTIFILSTKINYLYDEINKTK